MKASHILVKHLYEAEDILRALGSGKSFEALARAFSTCSSAKAGGWLGDLSKSKIDSDLLDALEALKIGEISKPIRTRFGYHIIRREKSEKMSGI